MALQTTSTLSNNLHSFYHKTLLFAAQKKLRLRPLGLEKDHPKGMGVDSFALKIGHVAESTDEITEGVTPSSSTIASTKYTITIKQYGQWIPLSDKLIKTAIDPVMEDVSKRLGYAAAKSMDSLIRDDLIANATNIIKYADGVANDNAVAAGNLITAPDVVRVVRELEAQDAPKFDDENYVWIIHPRNKFDIITDTSAGGFIELSKYRSDLDSVLNGEIGQAYGARIVVSSNMTYAANATPVNVYRTLVLAKDAFIVTKWNKDVVSMIINDTTSGGVANPLQLLGTAGYKMEFGKKYIGGTFSNDNGASPDLCGQLRGASTGG